MRAPLCALLTILSAASAVAAPEVVVPRTAVQLPEMRIGERDGAPLYQKVLLTEVFTVDKIYRSMQGPYGMHNFRIAHEGEPELLWITGFEATMVEPDGATAMSQEFMCHSNLSLTDLAHYKTFQTRIVPTAARLFSLAQGQLAIDLPEGFGIPAMSNESMNIMAQVLNHNENERSLEVRHRISVEYVRARDLESPLVPLHPRAVYGLKLVEGDNAYMGMKPEEIDPELHGNGCLIGEDMGGSHTHLMEDRLGQKFTGFWRLPEGREENRTLVTRMLELPYDTTVHYVAVHLHPYAESIALRDLTTGEIVYRSKARQVEEGMGLAEVDYFTSREGLPLFKDHEYEVVSTYVNTSGKDQDAMATMFLYLRLQDLPEAVLAPPPLFSSPPAQPPM